MEQNTERERETERERDRDIERERELPSKKSNRNRKVNLISQPILPSETEGQLTLEAVALSCLNGSAAECRCLWHLKETNNIIIIISYHR